MASLKARYHRSAAKELAAAIEWYTERDPVLGARFSDLYVDKLLAALESPNYWAKHRDGTRHTYLKPYSYKIVVRDRGDSLQIGAIAHTSRRSRYWRKRLRDF
jgi:hypothetical protein